MASGNLEYNKEAIETFYDVLWSSSSNCSKPYCEDLWNQTTMKPIDFHCIDKNTDAYLKISSYMFHRRKSVSHKGLELFKICK